MASLLERKLLLITPVTLQLVTLNPKLKSQQAPGALPASFRWWDATEAAWPKTSLRVRTLWLARWERGAFTYIDREEVISVGIPLQQYLGFLPGAGYGQFELRLTA